MLQAQRLVPKYNRQNILLTNSQNAVCDEQRLFWFHQTSVYPPRTF